MSAFVAHANAEELSPTPSEVMQKDDETSNVRRLRLLKRHRTRLAALVEDAEGHAAVEIRNISQTGAGLLSARSFKGNEAISLHLPGGRTLKAIVRWRRFGFCGVEFETPLAFDDQILPALTAEVGILRQTKASGKAHPESGMKQGWFQQHYIAAERLRHAIVQVVGGLRTWMKARSIWRDLRRHQRLIEVACRKQGHAWLIDS